MKTQLLRLLMGLLLTGSASAQNVTMGRISASHNGSAATDGVHPLTIIDLAHPAQAAGTIGSATVQWYEPGATCANAFKIKVFRQHNYAGDSYDLVGERGPFGTTAPIPSNSIYGTQYALVTVALDPPIAVQYGDVLAVTILTPSACGGPVSVAASGSEGSASIDSDFAGGNLSGFRYSSAVSIRASTAPQALVGIVPAVGTTGGAQGSQFRTLFQITNPSWEPESTATFVFHPAGRSASSNDPRITIPLGAVSTSDTTDLLAKMGVTGLGSLDVFTTGEAAPLVATHVFNDTGNGTNGFFEPMLTQEDAISFPADYIIPIPLDLTNYRVNVGVRSLSDGATLTVLEADPSGRFVQGFISTKTYPADYFEQVPLASFLSGANVLPGGVMWIQVTGHAFLYTSITDNRTNDSAISFVKPHPE